MLIFLFLGICFLSGYYGFKVVKKTNPLIIYVEGNIGTGKTTLLNKLNSLIEKSVICKEPVDEWISTCYEGKNILDKFYHERDRYAYMMQNIVYLTRINELICKIRDNGNKKVILCERSVFTDRNVFALQAYEDKQINGLEWIWYNKWHNSLNSLFNRDITPDGYIYLQCVPEISYERIKKRSRTEECDIPMEYINNIHDKHEQWFNNMNLSQYITINCNDDFENNVEVLNMHVEKIKKFIQLRE